MKKIWREYKKALKESEKAYKAYENDPENEEKEKAFDESYDKEFKAYTTLIDALVNFTNGMIDKDTAKMMIKTRENELENLIERLA